MNLRIIILIILIIAVIGGIYINNTKQDSDDQVTFFGIEDDDKKKKNGEKLEKRMYTKYYNYELDDYIGKKINSGKELWKDGDCPVSWFRDGTPDAWICDFAKLWKKCDINPYCNFKNPKIE